MSCLRRRSPQLPVCSLGGAGFADSGRSGSFGLGAQYYHILTPVMSVDAERIGAFEATAKLSFIAKTKVVNPCSIVSANWPSDDHLRTI